MTTIKEKRLQIILVIVGVFLISIFGLQLYAKHKVGKLIDEKLPENITLTYDDLDLNIFTGTLQLEGANCEIVKLESQKTESFITAETFEVSGFSYWSLWKHERFQADNLSTENAQITMFKKESDEVQFSINKMSFKLYDVKTDKALLQNKIPFEYKSIDISLDDLYLNLSRFEHLNVAHVLFNNKNVTFEDLSIASKYDKETLSKRLTQERDHVKFTVPSGDFQDFEIATVNDSFSVSATRFNINNGDLHLFRNKLLPDDFTVKTLYGSRLQNLPIKLNVESFFIKNTNVFYSEKVDLDIDPVSISFEHLDAEIKNLSNTNKQKTIIDVTAKLMGKAPLQFHWDFNTSDPSDVFNASAILKDLEASTINPFLESQANVRALGRIHEMYFTFYGNDFNSKGEMKMKYEDFKFTILNEDQLGINKTLSALVNILTNDGSKTDANGYRYGSIAVERDRTKSFFNYLWLNTKDGLKNTVVGNGKK
ncbi:DUF748 domain-containing protein [Algibacter miyuki]|nr:DUF748 domain-containing protein [Algibacter miyuki]MDN3667368.1 DUF748 domain-containing protein [Algibacter miyuki]